MGLRFNCSKVYPITKQFPACGNTDSRKLTGQPAPGSTTLWRVTFSARKPKKADVTFIAQPSQVLAPNGLVALNENKVLLADSANSLVFIFDINSANPAGDYSVFYDPLFESNGRKEGGVNGLKIRGNTLYFTSTYFPSSSYPF